MYSLVRSSVGQWIGAQLAERSQPLRSRNAVRERLASQTGAHFVQAAVGLARAARGALVIVNISFHVSPDVVGIINRIPTN